MTLTLDKTEAAFLFAVLASIGGSSIRSPRRYSDAILEQLEALNPEAMHLDADDVERMLSLLHPRYSALLFTEE